MNNIVFRRFGEIVGGHLAGNEVLYDRKYIYIYCSRGGKIVRAGERGNYENLGNFTDIHRDHH